MELRHLITFKTIVETGGFKKTADELGYAQSSITAHIKEIEKELGYPLFDRLGKKIELTQKGRQFHPYAIEIIDLYSKSKEIIKGGNDPSGKLVVGASESVMIYWLPKIIRKFMKDYPKVELVIKPIHYTKLSEQLKSGEFDLALLVENAAWDPIDLLVEKVVEDKLLLVRSSSPFRAETMLFPEYSCSWRFLFEEYLKSEGKEDALKIELPSIEAIKQCVLAGLGTSMLPQFTIKEELENKELYGHSTSEEFPLAIYTAMHKKKWRSPNVNVFLETIAKA
ncbi:LysR family transcriptional regulator [Halobacillus massiliensis]|uniref:LysR family transcriptional regulator n=1 Tax=Halobacillus massiliensis TaxID=1926286 RepID=UPI0009E286CF|nr:LysR family transcriptional regulator [Halobacillus massiliensis]